MEEARKEGEASMQEMTAKMEELANMQLAIQENEEKIAGLMEQIEVAKNAPKKEPEPEPEKKVEVKEKKQLTKKKE